jgi:hypothetical protein
MIIGAAKLFGEQNGSAGGRDIGAETGDYRHSRGRQYLCRALGRRRKRSRLAVYPRLTNGSFQPLLAAAMAWLVVLANLKYRS